MSTSLTLLLLPLLLGLSAFFSSSEASMFSADQTLLRHLSRTGHPAARRALALVTRPDLLLGIVLVGNNLVNSSIATLSDSLLVRVVPAGFESVANTLIATPVILLFGEFLPKVFARVHADRCAVLVATPLRVVGWLLWPLAVLTAWVAGGLTRLIARGGGAPAPSPLHTHEELDLLAEMATEQGALPPHTGGLLRRFFHLERRPIGEILPAAAHRPWLAENATLADVERLARESGHDLFPVGQAAPGGAIGTISLNSLLFALGGDAAGDTPIRPHVNHDLLGVPVTEPFGTLLQRLQSNTAPAILVYGADQAVTGVLTPHELFNALLLHSPAPAA